jgi:hypothetical protein
MSLLRFHFRQRQGLDGFPLKEKMVQMDLPIALDDRFGRAQAAHWFDLPMSYEEGRRVTKRTARWCSSPTASPKRMELVGHFYHQVVGPYWPLERKHVDTGYRGLPFRSIADRHAGVLECRLVLGQRVDVVGGSSGAKAAGQRAVRKVPCRRASGDG